MLKRQVLKKRLKGAKVGIDQYRLLVIKGTNKRYLEPIYICSKNENLKVRRFRLLICFIGNHNKKMK